MIKKLYSWHIVFVIILASLTANTYAAQIIASVDRNQIAIDDTLTLTVSATSGSQPDFSTLKNDFQIVGNSTSQSIEIGNGTSSTKKIWQLELIPKREGKLLIPSFTIGGDVTDAIEIQVSKKSPQQQVDDEQISATLELSNENPFVQEQVLAKVKLVSKVQIGRSAIQAINFNKIVAIQLTEPKRYYKNINGITHLIEEANFALFPQESGNITLPAVNYAVEVENPRSFRTQVLQIPTKELQLNVKPAPAEASGKPWQPANNVTIHETWSASLDHLKAGEPITRTITISADGLTAGQIAPLPTNAIEGLTFYPDQPQTADNKSDENILGTRTEAQAIIAKHGGTFTLPEINIEWWDNKTQSIKIASLPAKTLTVLGEAAPLLTPTQTATNAASVPQANSNALVASTPAYGLWISNLIFILLSLGLAAYVFKLKSELKAIANQNESAHEIISEKEKHIWDLLKQSAANKDATSLRKTVLSWAKFHWPEASIHSLDDVAKLAGKIELTQEIHKLDEVLYSNRPIADWEANSLLQLLNECRKEKNVKKKSDGLKPLYQN